MSTSQRISAALGYLPVIGWIYIFFFQRKNSLAEFHLKQSISLILSLAGIFLFWAVVGWIITWIPYGYLIAIVAFTLVIVAFLVGVISWITGILNALRGKMDAVPLFGSIADRIPL